MTFKALMKRLVSRYFSDEEAIVLGGLLIVGLLVVLLFGSMLAPFFTALIIAFVLQGGVSWLERCGLPRLVAVGLIFILFLGVLLTLALIVLPLVWNQLAHLIQEIPDLLGRSRILLEELRDRYPTIITPDQIQRWISTAGNEFSLLGRRLLSLSLNSLGSLLGVVIYLVLVPILVFFMLKDRERLIGFLLSLLPKKRDLMTRIWWEMDDQIANFIRGKFIEIVIVAVVSWVTFWALGLPYATLLALIVGLSVLVPYIGAAVATLPIAAVAGLTFGFSDHFLWVMVAYAILQALDGNVLVPVLFSEAVNLHPVAIILAVLFFGGIWGFWGIFFAIPLATLLKALMFAWPRNRDRLPPEEMPEQGSS